jgi:hypothetical protein
VPGAGRPEGWHEIGLCSPTGGGGRLARLPTLCLVKGLAAAVDSFVVIRARRIALSAAVRLAGGAAIVVGGLALAGCGSADKETATPVSTVTAKECADRWNTWAPALEVASADREMLDRTLKRIKNPVTVVARRGDRDSANCGLVLWLTSPSADGNADGVGQFWASPDGTTPFALNRYPMTVYPVSAEGGDVVDYEILWGRDLSGPWHHRESSVSAQAQQDAARPVGEPTPTVSSERSSDRSTGARGDDSAGEIVLNVNWMGAADDPSSLEVRPEHIGAGTSVSYSNLRWSGWGSKRAMGKGMKHWGDCGSCPEAPDSPLPVTLIASDPGPCRGVIRYAAVLIKDQSGKSYTTRFPCPETPANPIYEETVRESGMTEAELEDFFQRTVERGRTFARTYGEYGEADAACGELVRSIANRDVALAILEGDVVVSHVSAMRPERQIAALVALAQVAAQGCSYGVGAELSGD